MCIRDRPQSVYKTLYQQQGLRFKQGADRLTVAGALTPVSYTHLDVYKRQIWGNM